MAKSRFVPGAKTASRTAVWRAIAEARYLLRELDPDGEAIVAGRVGLISYKDCVDAIGEALGIAEQRRLHFWGARGSNTL